MGQTLIDFLTGREKPDTDMERLRQTVARFLVEEKGYDKSDIESQVIFKTTGNDAEITIPIDYIVRLKEKRLILIKCFPTALVTREKLTLACARLLEPYQIPFTVLTDGFATEVLDTVTGKSRGEDLHKIPSKKELLQLLPQLPLIPLPQERKVKEKRILSAFDLLKCPVSCKECSFNPG